MILATRLAVEDTFTLPRGDDEHRVAGFLGTHHDGAGLDGAGRHPAARSASTARIEIAEDRDLTQKP